MFSDAWQLVFQASGIECHVVLQLFSSVLRQLLNDDSSDTGPFGGFDSIHHADPRLAKDLDLLSLERRSFDPGNLQRIKLGTSLPVQPERRSDCRSSGFLIGVTIEQI